MRMQCQFLAIHAVVLAFGGILVGCPLPDARLEDLPDIPCNTTTDCDDGNPCTDDSCNATTAHCVFSTLDGVALPLAEPGSCFERVCKKGTEVKVPVESGIAVTQQTAGDCRKIICDGTGHQTEVDDATDVFDDANDCTVDACEAGIVKNTASAPGSLCGQDGVLQCNGTGQCVGCTQDAQCSNGGNSCLLAVCNPFQNCTTIPQLAGTELPSGEQTAQDCKRKVCDDSGHGVEVFDTNDGIDDGNDCTYDVCNEGTPAYPPKAAGAACGAGGGKVCDGLGNCRSKTSDPCLKNTECASGFCVDGVCCEASCSETCKACSAFKKGYGVNGACQAIAANKDPDDECSMQAVGTCGTTGLCNGMGACAKYAPGTICNAASCMQSTLHQVDVCDGAGTCVDGGSMSCAADTYCAGGQCLTKKQNGIACSAAGECTSNYCVDGVCCSSACSTTCVACNVTGSVGTCKHVPFPTADAACPANQVCNGSGNCKAGNGQSCGSPNQCASDACSGGICKSTTDQPCTINTDCVSGTCVGKICD